MWGQVSDRGLLFLLKPYVWGININVPGPVEIVEMVPLKLEAAESRIGKGALLPFVI